MENAIYRGEGILVNKWSYGLRLPFPSWFGYHRIGYCRIGKGDIVLFNNPGRSQQTAGIERRDVFIGRCIGLAGDTLFLNRELSDTASRIYIPDSKELYAYPAQQEKLVEALIKETNIGRNTLVSCMDGGYYVRSFSHYEYYLLSQKAGNRIQFTALNRQHSEVHPFIVPRKGQTVAVRPWNAVLLYNTLLLHEHRRVRLQGDTLLMDGKAIRAYTFSKNYYWMAANNPVNLSDSRLFGFVPEDHIIGQAWRIWWPSRIQRFLKKAE